ncbi:S8 family peptidase [Agaribacter flavus]|uniref:S8 family peptidase n=1 Tax=Agaribacter flavus TaxID=1902781 RepID=A0ABV7FUA8_9ALTE
MNLFSKFSIVACSIGISISLNIALTKHVFSSKAPAADMSLVLEQAEKQSYIIQGASIEKLTSLLTANGASIVKAFPIINAVSAVLTNDQFDALSNIKGLSLKIDAEVKTQSPMPAHLQWEINNNIAQQVEAHRLHTIGLKGRGVTIAIVDSGVNVNGDYGRRLAEHADGNNRLIAKYDATKGMATTVKNDDQNGHGTHVASIIATQFGHGTGQWHRFNGIAPEANILPVKAFDAEGKSDYSTVLDALNWIYQNRKQMRIQVVNLSMGTAVTSRYWEDPINQAVTRLWDAGIVVVASAGNNGETHGITVPGNNPYIITAGAATDNRTPFDFSDDRIASFSAMGPTYDGFVKPDVVAPATNIAVKLQHNILARQLKRHPLGHDYAEISGTSQAAAIVTGVAALVVQNNPHLSPDDVKCKIMTAARAAIDNGKYTFSPFKQGAGLVDAYEAVMTHATGCANRGLDIKADIANEKHFVGPVEQTESGEFGIRLDDGTLVSSGLHWATNITDLQGLHWGASSFEMQGLHWSGNSFGVLSANWSGSALDINGLHWGEGRFQLMQVSTSEVNSAEATK